MNEAAKRFNLETCSNFSDFMKELREVDNEQKSLFENIQLFKKRRSALKRNLSKRLVPNMISKNFIMTKAENEILLTEESVVVLQNFQNRRCMMQN